MGDLVAFFYILVAGVWLVRSARAFGALKENPVVYPRSPSPTPPPLISVLLPVKNEEENLGSCLKSLLGQDSPAREIIVINDHSVDRTAEILSEYTRLYPTLIRPVNAPEVPAGWTGKNWALHQGAPLAQGDWLLFTDADTRHEPSSLSSALAHAEARDLDLLTLSPRCLVAGGWEKILQPAAMGLMGLWFPFSKINDPASRLAFGNGQFLMIRKSTYAQIGGHEKVKGEFLEDFALVKAAKAGRFRAECALGGEIFGTRMYRSFPGIWRGWRRIFFHAFEKNFLRLLLKSASVFAFSFLPFFLFPFLTRLAFLHPERYGNFLGAGFPVLALILLTAWKTCGILKAPRAYALLHPVAGLVLAGILLDATRAALLKKELKWR